MEWSTRYLKIFLADADTTTSHYLSKTPGIPVGVQFEDRPPNVQLDLAVHFLHASGSQPQVRHERWHSHL